MPIGAYQRARRTRVAAGAVPPRDSLLCLLFSVLLCGSSRPIAGQSDGELKKVLVDLAELPDPFTTDKLPAASESRQANQSALKCYSLVGCYEQLPIGFLPQDPMDLKTEFHIYYKEIESVVVFDRYENCLEERPDECDRYPVDLGAIKSSPFEPTRRTIVVTAGYRSKDKGNWEMQLKDTWSQLDDVNVIMVGWGAANGGIYATAASNSRAVARQLTVLLYYLAKLAGSKAAPRLDLNDAAFTENFYLIGHSLGAHISGFVGADLAGRVGRITGLDPAGPSFDGLDRRFRLDRSDARLVDVLHTNAGAEILTVHSKYGTALASGHIDLWANDGVHQPGCSSDVLGCSHKRANLYYAAYLSHQLSMRNFLKNGDSPLYRLQAYRSDSYDEFQDGRSLLKLCPTTCLDDADVHWADLASCAIPVDYLSWFDVVRAELETRHKLDLGVANNFYFYTGAESLDQMDHYLVKVRVRAAADPRQPPLPRDGCSVEFRLEMADGRESNYSIRLVDQGDHQQIVFPFLSPSSASKYEIAKLDADDFLVERKIAAREFLSPGGEKSLRERLERVFPTSVLIRGFRNTSLKKPKRGILSSIARFFGMAKSQPPAEDAGQNSANCQLDIESFTIQPLRKFHRHLSAFYSGTCARQRPKLNVVLLHEDEPSPRMQLFEEAAAANCENKADDTEAELSMHTIILGPKDSSLAAERGEGELEFEFEPDEHKSGPSIAEEQFFEPKSLMVEPPTPRKPPVPPTQIGAEETNWMLLTLALLLAVTLLALAVTLTAKTNSRAEDRNSQVLALVHTTSCDQLEFGSPNGQRAHGGGLGRQFA